MSDIQKDLQNSVANPQSGQSLIETIVALGLLVTGITGGLALAVYSLTSSDIGLKQLVATGLAREGIEVARNMRDSNWMADTQVDCSSSMGTGQFCYPDWDDQTYNIAGSATGAQKVEYFSALGDIWGIADPSFLSCDTRLHVFSSAYRNVPFLVCFFFGTTNTYYRQVIITRDATSGFSVANPRLVVRSTVWWKGRGCVATDTPPAGAGCKVIVEEYLTNWKNF